ncbi:MAG: 50S ribosomal protein L32e [Nanoarchaeota archaeon]
MADMNLLNIRKVIKARKPEFHKQDHHKKKRVESAWRRPRGVHSKIRHNKWSYNKKIQIGYKSPTAVRGLDPSGLEPVLVSNKNQLLTINSKTQGIIIAAGVGMRKRAEIIKSAGTLTILNLKNNSNYLTMVKDLLEQRKKRVAERLALSQEKTKTRIKTTKEAKQAIETKREDEKKEKDKILTQKS